MVWFSETVKASQIEGEGEEQKKRQQQTDRQMHRLTSERYHVLTHKAKMHRAPDANNNPQDLWQSHFILK